MADTVEQWIADLEEADKLTPEIMVAEAADPDHPAHDRFEWDDVAAGHSHRLWQARQLVARVRCSVAAGTGRSTPIRKYTHLGSEGRYMRTDRAVDNSAWRNEIVEDAKRAARYFTQKYKALGNDKLIELLKEALDEDT